MPVLSRLILIFCLALYHPASALAQSSSESLGFAKAGAIAMDGEGIVRVRPDAARIPRWRIE